MNTLRVKNPPYNDIVPHLPTSLGFKQAGIIELRPPVLFGTHGLSSYEKNISKIPEETFNMNNIHLNMEESIQKEFNRKLPKDFYTIPDRIGKTNTEVTKEKLSKIKQDQTLDVSTELNNVNVKESKISPVKGA
ncbi:MAG: hypothetical protein KTV77_04655 [Wolbachia endosymbiont of Fragariocoptes setiger]|nr:hypothetical protein [Wolbachia endosymbiont of Fragariocoptes setiger]